jgi:hypothetical protein
LSIQVQEASRTPNRFDQNRNSPWHHIIIKTISIENRGRILKAVRKKKQTTYKCKPIKIRADISMEILKARRAWSDVFQALNENNFNPRILYPEKASFKIDGAIKIFHYKQKIKQYMTTKPSLQKILKEFCTQKMKANNITGGQEASNHKRKDKQPENSNDLTAHNQILKQQKQLNGRTHHIPININTEC